MSWWKGLIAVIVEAVAGWGQSELTKPKIQPEPPKNVIKYGKRDR